MQLSLDAIVESAMQLPECERFALVSRLLKTLPPEDSAMSLDDDSLVEKLDRRFADHAGCVLWSQLCDER